MPLEAIHLVGWGVSLIFVYLNFCFELLFLPRPSFKERVDPLRNHALASATLQNFTSFEVEGAEHVAYE